LAAFWSTFAANFAANLSRYTRQRRLFATIPLRKGAIKLSSPAELSQFLSSVERRAYKLALYAVRDEHAALDIVQDAMIKLAEKYGGKPAAELPLLFQRILQNTIRDHYRRQKVRNAWTTLFSSLSSKNESDEFDPLDSLSDKENQSSPAAPDDSLQQSQVIALIERALVKLPARQREAFLLRYWEGMDTTETAITMGCSEGSVKTHCSRAAHALAAALKEKGIELP
jgi:RNA polymerase sigma-70 factor (ECF subfamily)